MPQSAVHSTFASESSPGSKAGEALDDEQEQNSKLTTLFGDIIKMGTLKDDYLDDEKHDMNGRISISDLKSANTALIIRQPPQDIIKYCEKIFKTPANFAKEWNEWCPEPEPGKKHVYRHTAIRWARCLEHMILTLGGRSSFEADITSGDCLARLSGWVEDNHNMTFENGIYDLLASELGWGESKSPWEASKFYRWYRDGAEMSPCEPSPFVSCLFFQEYVGDERKLTRGELTCVLAMIWRQISLQQKHSAPVLLHSVNQGRIRHIHATFQKGKLWIQRTDWTKLKRSSGWELHIDVLTWILAQPRPEGSAV